eukprot:gene25116-31533_t
MICGGGSGSRRSCSGIVLHGPSGCGKTSLAKWLAGTTSRHFKCIEVSCADLVHKLSDSSAVIVIATVTNMSCLDRTFSDLSTLFQRATTECWKHKHLTAARSFGDAELR